MNELISKLLAVGGGVIDYPGLGCVELKVNLRARRFVARWKQGRVVLTVPLGATARDVGRALDELAPRLAARRPALSHEYKPGTTMSFDGFEVTIHRQTFKPGMVIIEWRFPNGRIGISETFGNDEPGHRLAVSNGLKTVARKFAPQLLLPRAQAIAKALGCHPKSWSVSNGLKTLGRCTSDGHISLSAYTLFLPSELRDYIICHELAHLSEMNHSPRFHAICDAYCSGREAELASRLRHFVWPIIR